MFRHPHPVIFLRKKLSGKMDPRWDEEAMLKRELAKLHTGEERRLKKGWMTSWVRNGTPANTNRQLRAEG